MKRRAIIAAAGALVAERATMQEAPALVAVLSPPAERNNAALRRGLLELGLIEGRHFRLARRDVEGSPEQVAAFAKELVALRPRVIFAGSGAGIQAMTQATQEIPIVFVGGQAGLPSNVQNLARPGGNVTGFSLGGDPRLIGKRLAILKEAAPRARRMAAIFNRADAADVEAMVHLQDAARTLDLTVELVAIGDYSDLAGAFAAATRVGEALYVSQDPFLFAHRAAAAALAAASALPAIYGFRDFVDAGGLMSYGVNLPDLYFRAAGYVARILRGEKPAEMPVQLPTKLEFVINLVAAKAMNLALPMTLIAAADEVIE